MNSILKIGGLIILAIVGLAAFGSTLPDNGISQSEIEYAVSPWGDDPVVGNETVVVFMDATDAENIEYAQNWIWKGAFSVDGVNRVAIRPYVVQDDQRIYLPIINLTREEWERS